MRELVQNPRCSFFRFSVWYFSQFYSCLGVKKNLAPKIHHFQFCHKKAQILGAEPKVSDIRLESV